MEFLGLRIRIQPKATKLIGNRNAKKASQLGKSLQSALRSKIGAKIESNVRKGVEAVRSKTLTLVRQIAILPRATGLSQLDVRPVEDGWMISERGSSLPLHVFPKKQDAVRQAKQMARTHKTGINIFSRDGGLQTQQSFS